MGRGRGAITNAMLTDPDITNEQAAAMQAARRNAGRIPKTGEWSILEILAAIVEYMHMGGWTGRRGDEPHKD